MSHNGHDFMPNFSLPLPNCGVTTITTPTLTPTTLRNIEDILGNSGNSLCPLGSGPGYLSGPGPAVNQPMEHQYQAGFVPPAITSSSFTNSDTSCDDSQFDSDELSLHSPGLREKPGMSDDEKKRMRRERNKQAAARCRQRRIEYTNKLCRETEELENGNATLKNTLSLLLEQKAQLEATLMMHNQQCSQILSS